MNVLYVFHGQYYSGAELVAFSCLNSNPYRNDYAIIILDNPLLERDLKLALGQNRVICLKQAKLVGRYERWISALKNVENFNRIMNLSSYYDFFNVSGFDLVIYNNSIEAAIASSWYPDIPEIVHVHDMVGSLPFALKRRLKRKILAANHIITVSEAASDEIKWLSGGKVVPTVVYNEVKFEPKTESSSNRLFKDFAFFGGEDKRKGLKIALKALMSLEQDSVSLSIYGEISESKQQRLRKKFGNLDLRFFGKITKAEVKKAILRCDAVLVPSIRDPLPTIVLESLSLNQMVFASKVDGIPEMVVDDHFLFEVGNHLELSRKLKASQDARRSDVEQKLNDVVRHAKTKFDVGNKCKNLNEIFQTVSASDS